MYILGEKNMRRRYTEFIRRNHAHSESENTRHREHTLPDLPDEITYWLWVETQGDTMSTPLRMYLVRSPTIYGENHRKIHRHTLADLSASFQRDDVRSEGRKTRRHCDQSFLYVFEEATHCLCAKTSGDTIRIPFCIHLRRSRTSWWRRHKETPSVRISTCMKRYHAQSSGGEIRRHGEHTIMQHHLMGVHTGWGENMRHHQNTFLVSEELLTRITYPLWDNQRLFLRVSQEITQGDTINTSFCINATRVYTLLGKKERRHHKHCILYVSYGVTYNLSAKTQRDVMSTRLCI